MSFDTHQTTRLRFTTQRHPCPSCKSSRGFAPVLTETGGLDLTSGKCHACGAFITPKSSRSSSRPSQWTPPPSPEPTPLSADAVKMLQRLHATTTADHVRDGNGLASYLIALSPKFVDALRRYDVGTDSAGRAVFWHRDESGQLLTAKSVPYTHTTGKRDKADALPAAFGVYDGPTFVSLSSSKGYASPCLFGVHLLDDDLTRPVLLVESEKSAVIASVFLPDFVCLASGGATGMTRDKAKALTGRDVMIVGDRDESGRKGAAKAADILQSVGARPRHEVDGVPLCDLFMTDGGEGYDVADFYLNRIAELDSPNVTTVANEHDGAPDGTAAANAPQRTDDAEADTMSTEADKTSPRARTAATLTTSTPCPSDDATIYALTLRAFRRDESVDFDEINARCVAMQFDGGAQVVSVAIMRGYVGVRGVGGYRPPYRVYLTGRRPNA